MKKNILLSLILILSGINFNTYTMEQDESWNWELEKPDNETDMSTDKLIQKLWEAKTKDEYKKAFHIIMENWNINDPMWGIPSWKDVQERNSEMK